MSEDRLALRVVRLKLLARGVVVREIRSGDLSTYMDLGRGLGIDVYDDGDLVGVRERGGKEWYLATDDPDELMEFLK